MSGQYTSRRLRHPCDTNGFTLIELLVVIAIISLLVSILLPSLTKAKELTKSSVCMSNQRSLFLSILYYTEDNDELIFPVQVSSSLETANRWRQWPWKLVAQGLAEYDKSNFIITSQMFYCPSFIPESPEDLLARTTSSATSRSLYIYGLREWIQPVAPKNTLGFESYKNFSIIPNAANFFLLGDSYLTNTATQWYAIGRQNNALTRRVHLRHGDCANFSFADGHVGPVDREYVTNVGQEQWEYSYGNYLAWPD